MTKEIQKGEKSGGDVNYYLLEIKDPKRLKPYTVECEDIIEALKMNFAEGNAFKAIWRSGAQRALGLLKSGGDAVYDAEKVAYYGQRMTVQRKREAAQLELVALIAAGDASLNKDPVDLSNKLNSVEATSDSMKPNVHVTTLAQVTFRDSEGVEIYSVPVAITPQADGTSKTTLAPSSAVYTGELYTADLQTKE